MNAFSHLTGSTNKSKYCVNGICRELVRIERFLSSEMAFLWAGHTKVPPDKVFANISIMFEKEDCFNHLYVYNSIFLQKYQIIATAN